MNDKLYKQKYLKYKKKYLDLKSLGGSNSDELATILGYLDTSNEAKINEQATTPSNNQASKQQPNKY